MKKYKIKPYDEVNDVWLLYRHSWWIFYSFVSAGSKLRLTKFVEDNNGVVVSS